MSDQLTEVYASIDALVDYALDHLDLDPRNADWTRNQIFALFHLDSYPGPKTTTSAASVSDAVQDIVGSRSQAPSDEKTPDPLLAAFRAAATTAGLFDPEEGPAYADTIMGILSANPADLDDRFLLIEHRDGGMAAMQWFYDYCVANNYVKRAQLDRNPRFDSHGLTVTINLAKPEFKNMKKAAAGNAVSGGYPKCTICHENEGFAGRDKRTLRTLPVTLGGESWFWQFSPYGYFDQHGICVNTDHTPMHVDRDTFGHLLDFVDRFPGYFLGCNAALPRIGGSVLAHDHYQGGGELLPTETGFINRKMAKEHWRLGCQVKVKENLKIHVPESVLGVKKWECEVISNRNISTFLKEFVVKLPEGENLKFRSGGYIQIDIPKYDAIKFSDMDIEEPYREDWDKMKMWDLVTKNPEPTFRAYSMANHPAEGNIIMLNIRIATPPFDRATGTFAKVNPGICSSYIFSRKPGDKVTISGPYGEFFLPDNLPATQELVFIGGGAGMAPMRSHIMHLFKTEKTSRPVSFWYGARALKEVPYMDEFLEIQREFPNFKFHLALDRPDPQADAAGVKYTPGFVHNVLYENYLKNHQAPEDNIYLMCGPPMMISSVVKMLDSLGVPSENILYDNFGS